MLQNVGILFLLCSCLNFGIAQNGSSPAKNNLTKQLLTEAANAFANGNISQAKLVVQKILIATPRNEVAQTLAGVIADGENDLITAENHFAIAAKLSPNAPETRNNYGAILLKLNRKADAAKEFTASLAANPKQSSALVNLANIRFAEGNFKIARALFEKAKAIAPDAEILRALLLVSLQLNEKAQATENFKEYFSALKYAAISETAESQIELGAALLANKLLAEGEQYLELVVASEANNVAALILLSRAYLEQKNITAAGQLLESAVARGLNDAKIYLALSEVYQTGGYFENAIPAMRLAIEKDPQNEFYLARYGLLLISAKAPAAAIIRLKEAAAQMPGSARLWLALGIAQLTEGGNQTEAQASFEQSLKIEPRSVPALAYLGTIYTEKADYNEAAKTYQRAIGIEQTNALLHYLLADTMLKMPESDQAIVEKHLQRAVTLDAKLASAHFALGKLYARAERWTDAAAEFRQTVDQAPNLAEAHYQLGRTLARLKQTAAANVEFEKYKKLNETQSAQKEIDRRELVRRLANVKF